MEPKISIIVPIYNVENYLVKCIDSIINQSYKNLEIILVDDESPDNCGKICDDYKLKDDRIVVIHQKNKGLSGARNSGLNIATGDYIAFVDSDDWVDLNMYDTMIKIAKKYQLDMIECGITESDIEKNNTVEHAKIKIENTWQTLKRVLKTSQFSACTKLFKKSIIDDSRFLLNKTSEDIYFLFENISKMNKLGYFDYPFYYYRPNPEGITKSPYNLKRFNDSITACLFVKEKVMSLISYEKDLSQVEKNRELTTILSSFVLKELMYHYKMLNYYPKLDQNYIHRKRLKKLINENYFKSKTHSSNLKLAKSLPIVSFEIIIKLNKLKHRIFRTKHFS
ncbi:glycosyltransferase family 2 protein [Ichthyenterobacterium magnum]|uniref:Glycosyl transferase family 2 n=1 Tax=Ichthyenterobacterium magnum TaxID=1230530 RepID=A0A420DM41_9FLAO|nr:glycosyltransferase [Ichthyenterobacterium magnum]RKE95312.1 glycosyl transferase family 2 [Ichthyenterobacterium magnum]